MIARPTCLQTTCALTSGIWRSLTAALVSFLFFFSFNHYLLLFNNLIIPIESSAFWKIPHRCTWLRLTHSLSVRSPLILTSLPQILLTLSQPIWRSWPRSSQQQSSTPTNATRLCTAAARDPSACVTWGHQRCVTITPKVSPVSVGESVWFLLMCACGNRGIQLGYAACHFPHFIRITALKHTEP